MAYPAELYDSELNMAHPVLFKSQQQFIKSTFSLLPGLSVGRHLFTLPLLCTVILLQLAISVIIKNGFFRSSNIDTRIAVLKREKPMAKTKPTSLDGRSQKLSKPAWKPKEQPGPILRPASPPKSNPWRKRVASTGSDQEKPVKSLQLTTEEFPKLGTPEKSTDTAASEKANSPSSCDVLSKASSTTNETQSEETGSGVSRLSTPTRLILEEAADQAAKILWRHPFGSNVYLYVETSRFQLHRDILTRHSGWFRDKLPPPNEDGSPVEMHLPHAVGAVQPCLYFMYTKNIDICERDSAQPLNFLHIPRCVLAYCAAVNFQIPTMAARILGILEETARHLTTHLSVNYIYKEIDFKTSKSLVVYFVNSVDIMYSEPLFELMKPVRHALAGILDALLPYLLRQPSFPEMLSLPSWKRWSAAIAADQVEYRTAHGRFRSPGESIIPDEIELEALFDRVLGQLHRDQEKKDNRRGPHNGDSTKRGSEEPKEDEHDTRNGTLKKKNAVIPEFIKEESALEHQAPSLAGSTGSETSTWNSLGTDDAKAEQRGYSGSRSFTHNNTYARSSPERTKKGRQRGRAQS